MCSSLIPSLLYDIQTIFLLNIRTYVRYCYLNPLQMKFRGNIVILMSVRSFVRPSVFPPQSLTCYSSKTAEQNFMILSGNCSLQDAILHLLFEIFIFMNLGCPRAKQGLSHYDIWGGTHLYSATPLRTLNRIS